MRIRGVVRRVVAGGIDRRESRRGASWTRRSLMPVVVAGAVLSALLLGVVTEAPAASAVGTSFPEVLKEGGSLTVLETGDEQGAWPEGLDPGTSDTPAANQDMEDAIFGELFELGPKGATVPDLATGYKFLDGGKTVAVSIRQGVKFSDGTPFNAAAVVFNWNRDLQLKGNDLPTWPFAPTNPFTVAGPYTADINLTRPYSPIIDSMHDGDVNWIVSPTALQKMGETQFRLTPVGAGPFTVVSDTISSELVLKKNPTYWQTGLPYLENLTFKDANSDGTALEGLQAGQAQAYVDMTTPQLVRAFQSSFSVTQQDTGEPQDVQMNTTIPPFNNKLAREALYYATDTPALDKDLFNDITQPVEGFTGPGGLFYDPTVPGYRTYDLAKAKAIVKQLGGLSFTLWGSASATEKSEAEGLQAMWQSAGMKVTLSLAADLPSLIEAYESNKWEAGMGADGTFDPATGAAQMFRFLSTSKFSGVHDPKLDSLLEEATEVPESARAGVYQEIAKYESDNAYTVQLFPTFLWDVADKNVYAPCLTTVCPETEDVPEIWWQNAGYTK
jgi:peptide/nickel transport system substrate-binding protein